MPPPVYPPQDLPSRNELFNLPIHPPLHTNSAPIPEHAILIRNAIAHADQSINTIEAQIIEYTRTIQALVTEKEKIASLREEHARVLHPIFHIPPEIWAEVFRVTCHSYLTAARMPLALDKLRAQPDSLLPWNPVLTITRVCVDWRDVMRSLPEMWCQPLLKESCLALPDAGYYTNVTARLSALSSTIQLSGTRPLHITFCLDLDIPPSIWFLERAMRLFVDHHHRWKRLDIFDHEDQQATRAFNSCISSRSITELPMLDTLCYGCWPYIEDAEALPPIEFPNLHNGLPKLRQAWFGGRCPPPEYIPWGELERVTFSQISVFDCYLIIDQLVKAVNICITWDEDCQDMTFILSMGPGPLLTGYTLPCLENIEVSLWDSRFFGEAKMPKLRRISVAGISTGALVDIGELIERSLCRLIMFWATLYPPLFHNASPITVLPGFFSLTSRLRILNLNCKALSQEDQIAIVGILAEKRNTGSPKFCPILYTLQLDTSFWKEPLLVIVLDMIHFRWKRHRALVGVGNTIGGLRRVGPLDMNRAKWQRHLKAQAKVTESFKRLEDMEKEGLKVIFAPVTLAASQG